MNPIDNKNSGIVSPSTLTSALSLALILLLTLALTCVFSLRAVRLKIGDYYYNRGNFDRAFNLYKRVVRKEKLSINQDRGDCLEYEEDLSKLKSALIQSSFIRVLEEPLLKVAPILGFGQNKDLSSLLMDSKIFSIDINHLLGDEPEMKLQKVKDQLENFNHVFAVFQDLRKKEPESRELDQLILMSYFFQGLVNEAEKKYKSADSIYHKAAILFPAFSFFLNERRKRIFLDAEYLYQAPLNWVKAKDLYESQLSNGKTSVGLFLILGYIHAKFNNFSISHNYFRKACGLLKDPDLKKAINAVGRGKAFFFPDDLRLIPQQLMLQYPFLREISFFEAKNLLNILGIKVSARSEGFIGKTGIKSPVDIIIRSAGYLVGNRGEILINGKNVSQNKRGYNIVVLNPKTGEAEKSEGFDTCASKDDVKKMIDFINGISKDKIVCVAAADEASGQLSMEEGKIFEEIGGKGNLHGKWRWGHGIIGVKGPKCGEAIEAMNEKPLEIYVLKGFTTY